MVPERLIFRTAQLMIDRFGRDAPRRAEAEAAELAAAGDQAALATWLRIRGALDLLSAAAPRPGELLH